MGSPFRVYRTRIYNQASHARFEHYCTWKYGGRCWLVKNSCNSGILPIKESFSCPTLLMAYYYVFSLDVTPRKKHKKDKHKSGEDDSGRLCLRLLYRLYSTMDCKIRSVMRIFSIRRDKLSLMNFN